jgi:hypothetical protein
MLMRKLHNLQVVQSYDKELSYNLKAFIEQQYEEM